MNYVERKEELLSDDGFLQRVHEHVRIGLKKCPKCGVSVHSHELNIDELPEDIQPDYVDEGDTFYIVKCPKCGRKTIPFTTLEQAVEIWNTKS